MKNLKKIVAGVATIATLGMTSLPALASTGEEVHSGMVEDSNSLLRQTQERDGGTWNYGVGSVYVWSYYQHKSRLHKSSVKPGYFAQVVSSGWRTKGIQARASAPKAPYGNQMFYDVD